MEQLNTILARFPLDAQRLRRRFAEDANFRAICMDYVLAERALRHWQSTDPSDSRRAEDYAALCDELAKEIEASIGAPDVDASEQPAKASSEGRSRAPDGR